MGLIAERDITFCGLRTCKRRNTCYRFEPNPQVMDSFFIWPKNFNPDKCKEYLKEEI